ncbi:MAG: hypothetical protein OXM54_00460 [Acidimicrobiaceae bacterium]|nr:hypothetical protein [Acidimicrobiaceae bacterium]
MALERQLVRAHEELASGDLRLEINGAFAFLWDLGWDDRVTSHMVAERRIGKRRAVDEALFDECGNPAVFVEAKRQRYLQDETRYEQARRQLFRYARDESARILLLTDGETWDFFLRRAPGSPSERRFLRLTLTEPEGLAEAAAELRRFLARTVVLDGSAVRAAQARLKRENARAERWLHMQIAWQRLLGTANKTVRSRLADSVERDAGRRPSAREVNEFLRTQGEFVVPEKDPNSHPPRPYSYDELFPDDVPRTNYARDELEHLLPDEMADVVEFWTEEWEVAEPAERDFGPDELSWDIQFVLYAQDLHDGWAAAVDEIHEAAAGYDDERTCLEAMRMVELRHFAKRLPIQPGGRSKQDTVEALVACLEWF